jgi:hypothetical protein
MILGSMATERRMLLHRRVLVTQILAEQRRWTRSALAVRLVQVVAGLVVLFLLPDLPKLVVVGMLLGLALAVTRPARTGQVLVVGVGIAGWVLGDDSHASPPVLKVLAFALALFVLHDSTSLASTVPMAATLRREALLGWLRRSGLALLLAGLLAGVVYGFGALVDFTTSYPLEVAGTFGIVATLVAAAVLFSRSLR